MYSNKWFVFSYNASDSLNIITQGILKKGDHAICTMVEHNSVLRPLYVMEQRGIIEVDRIPFDNNGYVDPDDFKAKIKSNTKLVIVNHASNVIGTVQPINQIGKICRDAGVIFAIDAAQTAGMVPIDMKKDNIDIVAFTGHKSLFGPTGIGGLYVNKNINIDPIRYGGTGVKSAVKTHLEEYPFRLECGTLNILGVAGLNAGQKFIEEKGLENIHNHEINLLKKLIDGLRNVDGVTMYFPDSLDNRAPVLSFNIDGYKARDVGTFLDVDYNIAVRTGLQCAPLTHVGIDTSPEGTVRFSAGYFNTDEDINKAIDAVKQIASSRNKSK
ncbi:aminotransferase class V-fold PLP-dependent enzyme [candidate division KSB1 bacterium]